ncbi:MAG: hypothetical protein PUG62_03255, partial [Dialister sp.]|nr:hypothetical protein [Dialister sp.]
WLGIGRQVDIRLSRIVIESVVEKSLSFAVYRSVIGKPKRETCSPGTFRASPYLYSAALLIFMRRTNPFEPLEPVEPIDPIHPISRKELA